MRNTILVAVLMACACGGVDGTSPAQVGWVVGVAGQRSSPDQAARVANSSDESTRLVHLSGLAGGASAGSAGAPSPTLEAPPAPVAGAPSCADYAPKMAASATDQSTPAGAWELAEGAPIVCDPTPPCAGGVRSTTWCNPAVPWNNGQPDAVLIKPGTRVLVHASSLPPFVLPAESHGMVVARVRAPSAWPKPAVWSVPGYGANGDQTLDPSAWQNQGGVDCMVWNLTSDPKYAASRPGPALVDLSQGGAQQPESAAGWVEILVGSLDVDHGDLACP